MLNAQDLLLLIQPLYEMKSRCVTGAGSALVSAVSDLAG